MNLADKKVLVMGLGLHGGGVATTKWLLKHSAKVTVTDLKTRQQLQSSIKQLKNIPIKYILGKHRLQDFTSADLIVQNPDVPSNSKYLKEARSVGVQIENEASLFFFNCRAQIIGITGTRGKSTVAALTAKMLKGTKRKVWLAGNIRTIPMLSVLDKIKANDLVVLELSSFQLELLGQRKLSPTVAVVTNIYPDHLNRYPSLPLYRAAKRNIFIYQKVSDKVILNLDNLHTRNYDSKVKSQLFWFSTKNLRHRNGVFIKKNDIYFQQSGRQNKIANVSDIRLRGIHNIANALAAITVASIYKVPAIYIKAVLKKFKGLPDRMELVRTINNVRYINDTTASTPDAAMAALRMFLPQLSGKRVILIAGGSEKKIPQAKYRELGELMQKTCKATILLSGAGTQHIVPAGQVIRSMKSLSEALAQARKISRPGDVILLSPACASFGMFINEFDRGDQFRRLVKKI